MNGRVDEFELDPGLTYLNHASFGCPTRVGLQRAEARRRSIERDTAVALGPELEQGIARQAEAVAAQIGAVPGSVAIVENTTAGAAALWVSLPLTSQTRVLVLDVEYASVIRGLQVACARTGASLTIAHLPLPTTREAVFAAVATARPAPTVVVMSAVTSSTALVMPLRDVARWCSANGARLFVDGAHVVGHVPLDVAQLGVGAVFGTLHKWLPVPRSVGFLWVERELVDTVRPAEVSLRWDSPSLSTRFSWRGTWDPASALGVEEALAERAGWEQAGDLLRAASVAEFIGERLERAGLSATGEERLLAPRMRAFLAPGVGLDRLRESLLRSGVRAWTGQSSDGVTLLRIATHVYSDEGDAAPVVAAVLRALRPA